MRKHRQCFLDSLHHCNMKTDWQTLNRAGRRPCPGTSKAVGVPLSPEIGPIPHTCHGGQSPAGGTRCSGSSQHAPGGCWCSHRYTDASTSTCHIQGLQWNRAEVRAVPRAEPVNARRWRWDSRRIPRREQSRVGSWFKVHPIPFPSWYLRI